MVAVVEAVAAIEETLAVDTEAILVDHAKAADTEETLVDHVMVADTEETQVVLAHAMAAVTKVQTHVMLEAEMLVLQEATVYLEVTAEARVVTHLQKREAHHLHHAKAADTKEHVIAAIADHHALQEQTDQARHVVMQVALQKQLLVTHTKKTNF